MKMNEWDQVFVDCGNAKPEYDSWLCKFEYLLQSSDDYPVIDLGCGFGNDTLYLFEKGYRVISCDYSLPALRRLHFFIPEPRPIRFNFQEGLPFANESVKIVIADLSLHYFDTERTMSIIRDCQRIIKCGGNLICRVNSTKDYNHGAGQGTRVENNYFNCNGKYKRFFDRQSIETFFAHWHIGYCQEHEMKRYRNPKMVWEVLLSK